MVGEFNEWDLNAQPMLREGECWTTFLSGLPQYTDYKYAVTGPDGTVHCKADPYGFHTETRPATASKLYDITGFLWSDGTFCSDREKHPSIIPAKHPTSASRLLAQTGERRFLRLQEFGPGAGGLRTGNGLHGHRAAAGDGAPAG